MGHRWMIVALLQGLLALPICSVASTGDIGNIIETFVVHRFPDAAGHYWVINQTQWDGDEMIVDVHTVVTERRDMAPHLDHFLLLIVAGELKGVQNIPVEPGADCRAEEAA